MIDRLFLAALTFVLLAGGTLAIGMEMFHQPEAASPVYQLSRVVITGKRALEASVAKATPAAASHYQ